MRARQAEDGGETEPAWGVLIGVALDDADEFRAGITDDPPPEEDVFYHAKQIW